LEVIKPNLYPILSLSIDTIFPDQSTSKTLQPLGRSKITNCSGISSIVNNAVPQGFPIPYTSNFFVGNFVPIQTLPIA